MTRLGYRCVPAPPVSFYRYSSVSRVSCVCPGSPRCLFTGTVTIRHSTHIFFVRLRNRAPAPLTSEQAQTVCRDHTGSESPKQASVKQQERHMRLHEPSPLLALRGGSGGSAPVTLIAAALAATKSAHPVEASDSSDNVVATLIGYVVLAGSLFLYSPIIMQILRSRSGSGLSATSWALSLIGFGGALVYQSACGYPIHTYAELIALTAQTVAILSLLLYFDMHIDYRIIVAGLGAGSALFVALSRAPELVLKALQAVSGTLVTVSILPQIILPFRTGTCGWSPVSAALSTAGTAARVFTTWKITQDKLVLAGFVGGCLMNIVLLIQTFIYPNPIASS